MCWSYACFSYAGGGVLTACDPHNEEQDGTHTHEWSEEYSYDDEYHYKTCTVEGCDQHTGTEAHVYDDDQDATCNKCNYTRHVHTLKWNWDSENHWQEYICEHHADEQLNKGRHVFGSDGKCETCLVDKNTFHTHTYEWKYDDKQHWEMTTCTEHASEMSSNGKSDHVFQEGKCECGLEEIYITVYKLYKSNSEYKGESKIDDFATWYASLKEQHVDHVGLNSVGDAVFYVSEEDTTGEAKYFVERTVTIKTSCTATTKGSPVADVWFAINVSKAGVVQKVNGKEALVTGKSDEQGTATLTFIPAWGYTSSDVVYTAVIAKADEVVGPKPCPVNYEVTGDSSKALTVSGETLLANTSMSFERLISVGAQYDIENLELSGYGMTDSNNSTIKLRFADSIQPGWYKLDFETTTQGVISAPMKGYQKGSWESGNIRVGVMNNAQTEGLVNFEYCVIAQGGDAGGGKAFSLIYVDGNNKWLRFTALAVTQSVFNISLSKYDETTIDLSESNDLKVNLVSEDSNVPELVYNLTNVKPGKYMTSYELAGQYAYAINMKIGSHDPTPLGVITSQSELSGYNAFSVVELTQEDKTISFSTDKAALASAVGHFRLIPIEEWPTTNSATINFSFETTHYYSWTPSETAAYKFTLSGEEDCSDVKVVVAVPPTTSLLTNKYVLNQIDETVQSRSGYISVVGQNKYIISVTAKDQAVPEVELALEKSSQDVNLGADFEVKFTSDQKQYDFNLELDEGYYMLTAKGETGTSNVTLTYTAQTSTSKSLISVEKINGMITKCFVLTSADKGQVNFTTKYSASTIDGEVKLTMNLSKLTPQSISYPVGEINARFAEGNKVLSYELTATETCDLAIELESEENLQNFSVFSVPANGSSVKQFGAMSEEAKTRTHYAPITQDEKYVVVLFYEGQIAPSTVKVKLQNALKATTLIRCTSGTGMQPFHDYGVQFAKVDHATKYTLYEAATSSNECPAIGSEAFKPVKIFGAEPFTYQFYVSNIFCNDFIYANNDPETIGKYLYYYVVAEDETGTYASRKDPNIVTIDSMTRCAYSVTLNIPDELKGKEFFLGVTQNTSYYGTRFYGFLQVKQDESSKTYTLISSSANYKSLYIMGIGWDSSEYFFSNTNKPNMREGLDTLSSDSTTVVNVSKKVQIDVTLKLPNNFEGGTFNVYLYLAEISDSTITKETLYGSVVSQKVEANAQEQTWTFYLDPLLEEEKSKLYVSLNTNTILSEGYEIPKLPLSRSNGLKDLTAQVVLSDDLHGSAEIELKDKAQINVTLNLPDNFVGGNITLTINKQNGDRFSYFAQKSQNVEAGAKTATITLPATVGYKCQITFSGPSGGGYEADPLEFDVTAPSQDVSINVVGPTAIVVTVKVPESAKNIESVKVNLYESDGAGQPKGSSISSATAQIDPVTHTGTVTLYAAKSKTLLVVGSENAAQSYNTQFAYTWSSYANVTIDGQSGSATFECTEAYDISIGFTHSQSQTRRETVHLIDSKSGKSLFNQQNMTLTSGETYHIYIPASLYDASAEYYVAVAVSALNYGCAAQKVTFADGSKNASVTLEYKKADTFHVTINFPEAYQINASTQYKLTPSYIGNVKTNKPTSNDVDAYTLTNIQLSGTTYSVDITDYYVYSPLMTLTLSASGEIESGAKYLARTTKFEWNVATQQVDVVIDVSESIQLTLTVGEVAEEFNEMYLSCSVSFYSGDVCVQTISPVILVHMADNWSIMVDGKNTTTIDPAAKDARIVITIIGTGADKWTCEATISYNDDGKTGTMQFSIKAKAEA